MKYDHVELLSRRCVNPCGFQLCQARARLSFGQNENNPIERYAWNLCCFEHVPEELKPLVALLALTTENT